MINLKLASTIVELLGRASKQPNELGEFISDFANATVKWIRPLFLTGSEENEDLKSFKENPADEDSKAIVVAKVKKALNNDETMKNEFTDLLAKMAKPDSGVSKFINTITGDDNIVIQGGSGNSIHIKK